MPVLVLSDGTVLIERNSILLHYGEGAAWLPTARVHEWLFFKQDRHEPNIAVARKLRAWQFAVVPPAAKLQESADKGANALFIMKHRLSGLDWLVDGGPMVADLALFAYTHRADEGGFELGR